MEYEFLFLWIVLGLFFGIITGLLPGLHINTLAFLTVALPFGSVQEKSVFILAMAIMHSFLDFIPSIVFGAPSDDSFLSVLPGHRLLLQGKGFLAVSCTAFGGLFAGLLAVLFLPLVFSLTFIIDYIALAVPFVLLFVLFSLFLAEPTLIKKGIALFIIISSGSIGWLSFHHLLAIKESVFVAITGFYGISTLLISLHAKPLLPLQSFSFPLFTKKNTFLFSTLAAVAGLLVAVFPAIGSSNAAFFVSRIARKTSQELYLLVLGGINTAAAVSALFVFAFLEKTRNGAVLALQKLTLPNPELAFLYAAVVLFAIGISFFAVHFFAHILLSRLQHFPYLLLTKLILLILLIFVFLLAGFPGLLLLFFSTSLGILAIAFKVRRTHAMAFFLIPVLFYYFSFLFL